MTTSSTTRLALGRECLFCPLCKARLRNRPYPTLINRVLEMVLPLETEFRWQCLDCGYRDRGTWRRPLALFFSGLSLTLAYLALSGYEPEQWTRAIDSIKQGSLALGGLFMALSMLIVVSRAMRPQPVLKQACMQCGDFYVRNDAWTSDEYCSIGCVKDALENIGRTPPSYREDEDAEDELMSAEEVEEVDEEDEDIEDVEEVEDDEEEEDMEESLGLSPTPVILPPASAEQAPATEEEKPADDHIAEMVLFEEPHTAEVWDSGSILAEADDALDSVEPDEEEEAVTGADDEDIAEVEAAISLMDENAAQPPLEKQDELDVDSILAQSEGLDLPDALADELAEGLGRSGVGS